MIGVIDLKDIDRDGQRFKRHPPLVVCQFIEVDTDSIRPLAECDQPRFVVESRRSSLSQHAELGFETFAALAKQAQFVSNRSRDFFVIEHNDRLRRVTLLCNDISEQALDGSPLRLDSAGNVTLRPRDLLSDDVGISEHTAYEGPNSLVKRSRRNRDLATVQVATDVTLLVIAAGGTTHRGHNRSSRSAPTQRGGDSVRGADCYVLRRAC
jgi:hypothetical protein